MLVLKAAAVALGVVALTAPSHVEAPVADHAELVCEAQLVARLHDKDAYKAISVVVAGPTVTIAYQGANSQGAIMAGREQCIFVAREDGLHLVDEPALSYEEVCRKVALQGRVNQFTRDRVEACPAQAAEAQERFMGGLVAAGIGYPVSPVATKVVVGH